jgi:hypothetical protein
LRREPSLRGITALGRVAALGRISLRRIAALGRIALSLLCHVIIEM